MSAQSTHSKRFMALAAHEHSDGYGCGVPCTCVPGYTEEQPVLASVETKNKASSSVKTFRTLNNIWCSKLSWQTIFGPLAHNNNLETYYKL